MSGDDKQETFIDLVQAHERTWGTQNYPDRPSLAQLLSAPIVAWWKAAKADDDKIRATVHNDLEELDKYASRLLLHSRTELPTHRLAMVHINQKKAAVRGVKLNIISLES